MGLLSILGIVERVVDNVVPDPNKKMELKLELAKLADAEAEREHKELMGQVEVNKVEAGHRSIFVAGWRPAMGWVGAAALAMIYIIQPFLELVQGKAVSLDVGELMVLIGGLLGFGGMRSFDKLKGVSNDVLPLRKPNEALAQISSKPVQMALPETAPWAK